ncbi:hypothetical protein ACJJTC_016973 [Scirpophaga incertulas]
MWASNRQEIYNRNYQSFAPSTSTDTHNKPVCLQDDMRYTEIFDLDSSNDELDDKKDNKNNTYSNQSIIPAMQEYYVIYKQDEGKVPAIDKEYPQASLTEIADNDICNDIIYLKSYDDKKFHTQYNKYNHSNLFTLASNEFDRSESSTEDEKVSGILENNVTWIKEDSNQNGEMLSFDEHSNKHTVWIYSLQNHQMNIDDTSELFNVPIQDTSSSTSCSLENSMQNELEKTDNSSHRVSSPIPSAYIPRLNLIVPTLPTVAEITEPDENIVNCKSPLSDNKVNGWVDRNTNIGQEPYAEKNSIMNVVDWMCLSPRNKQQSKYIPINFSHAISSTSTISKKNNDIIKFNIGKRKEISLKKSMFTDDTSEEFLLIKIQDAVKDTNNFENTKSDKSKVNKKKNIKKFKPIKVLVTDGWILTKEVASAKYSQNNSIDASEHGINSDYSTEEIQENCSTSRVLSSVLANSRVTHTIPSLHLSIETDSERSCLNSFAAFFKCCYK